MTITAPIRTSGLPRLLADPLDDGLPSAAGLIEAVDASGLTGRGGAAFPAGRKLAAMAPAGTVVANGAEGEPLSTKDAALLRGAPQLVLDGLLLTAAAVHAREAVIVVKARHEAAVRAAIADRADAAGVVVRTAPDAFVAGEASSAARIAAGGPAKPQDRTWRLTSAGPKRRPVLVQNVETLAHIALIARYGAPWFRAAGTAADPGSRLLSLSGDVAHPGVIEVPGGVPLRTALRPGAPGPVRAVLVGGYHGRWTADLDAPLVGGGPLPIGAGVLHVLGPGRCGLAATATIAQYLAAQSAGQCGPCVNGLPALAAAIDALAARRRDRALPARVRELGALVTGRGSCHHPDGTARMVASALEVFADDVEAHLAGRCIEEER